MDREVVEQKLESLRRCLRRIELKCPAQAGVLNNELADNLKKAVDFRNILFTIMEAQTITFCA
jgi:hypothetical protein